jgi:peroxiredoxin
LNYYNDGKQWLFKYYRKKKTIFWASLLKDTFRITFYLGNKAEKVIENSDMPDSIKEEFNTAKRYGLIRPVTFIIRDEADVDNVLKMINIKVKLK